MYLQDNLSQIGNISSTRQIEHLRQFDVYLILNTRHVDWKFSQLSLGSALSSSGSTKTDRYGPNKNISKVSQSLVFPDFTNDDKTSEESILTLSAFSPYAAKIHINEKSSSSVEVSIVEDTITLINGAGVDSSERIEVFNWGFKTDEAENEVFHNRSFNSYQLNELRVGASARIKSLNLPGVYIGTATLKLLFK